MARSIKEPACFCVDVFVLSNLANLWLITQPEEIESNQVRPPNEP
jgi:hypothetical protein